MNDGDRLVEPSHWPKTPRVSFPPEVQHAGGTVLAVFGKYAFVIGALFAIAEAGAWLPLGFWQTLITSFGYVTCGLLVACCCYEVINYERKWFASHPPIVVPKAEPKVRVPFPPERFVKYLWDYYEKAGKFPTVDECEKGDQLGPFRRASVQEWFVLLENAGAWRGRVDKQTGAASPEWDRLRFIEAAKDANTLSA